MPALASKLPVASTDSPTTFGFHATARTLRLCPPLTLLCSRNEASE
jgi:hypothetical protein